MAFFGAIFLCLWPFIRRALPRVHWKAMSHVERGSRRAEIECLTENKLSTSRKSHIHSQLSVPTCRSTPKAIVLVSPRSPPKGARITHDDHFMSYRPIRGLPLMSGTREPERRLPLWWIISPPVRMHVLHDQVLHVLMQNGSDPSIS